MTVLAGCSTPGLLYTDITLPLTKNMHETPVASDVAQGRQHTIRDPFAGIRAEWSSYAPGDTAQDGGIEVVHYVDVRRQSVLGGLWGRTTAIVYGRSDGVVAAP